MNSKQVIGGYAVSNGEYSGDLKGTYQIGGMPV
jgi:hypothetical protein